MSVRAHALRRITLAMWFAALLRGPSAAEVAAKRTGRRQRKNNKHPVEASLELGERAAAFLESCCGQERAA